MPFTLPFNVWTYCNRNRFSSSNMPAHIDCAHQFPSNWQLLALFRWKAAVFIVIILYDTLNGTWKSIYGSIVNVAVIARIAMRLFFLSHHFVLSFFFSHQVQSVHILHMAKAWNKYTSSSYTFIAIINLVRRIVGWIFFSVSLDEKNV